MAGGGRAARRTTECRKTGGLDNAREWDKLLLLARVYQFSPRCVFFSSLSFSHFSICLPLFLSLLASGVHLLPHTTACPSQRLIQPVQDYLLPM